MYSSQVRFIVQQHAISKSVGIFWVSSIFEDVCLHSKKKKALETFFFFDLTLSDFCGLHQIEFYF